MIGTSSASSIPGRSSLEKQQSLDRLKFHRPYSRRSSAGSENLGTLPPPRQLPRHPQAPRRNPSAARKIDPLPACRRPARPEPHSRLGARLYEHDGRKRKHPALRNRCDQIPRTDHAIPRWRSEIRGPKAPSLVLKDGSNLLKNECALRINSRAFLRWRRCNSKWRMEACGIPLFPLFQAWKAAFWIEKSTGFVFAPALRNRRLRPASFPAPPPSTASLRRTIFSPPLALPAPPPASRASAKIVRPLLPSGLTGAPEGYFPELRARRKPKLRLR